MGQWWTWIYEWSNLQYQDIAQNLRKGQFAPNLKNGSGIYEHVQLSKVYTRGVNEEAVCLVVLFFNVLSRHANIMTNKGFNIFDDCAARCVHLPPQEEECTFSSWGDTKRYTSGNIAYSQRMLAEINESSAIAKIRIWVGSNTVRHLKAFGIVRSKMHISLLTLSWWLFGCLHI